MSAVICHSVKKSFGKGENQVEVLRGVDFEVAFGKMSLLVGPSGCGKTTLLCVIAGLLDASGGKLEVLGQDMGSSPERQECGVPQAQPRVRFSAVQPSAGVDGRGERSRAVAGRGSEA